MCHQILIVRFVSGKPSPPQNLRVKDVSINYVTLEWEIPKTDGGSPVTGYVIEKRDMKRSNYVKVSDVSADCLVVTADKLVEGSEYLFRVCAENSIGASDWTTLDEPVKARHLFGKLLYMYM